MYKSGLWACVVMRDVCVSVIRVRVTLALTLTLTLTHECVSLCGV